MSGDNRTVWQKEQVSAQLSPSIDRLTRKKCKHSIDKNHPPAICAQFKDVSLLAWVISGYRVAMTVAVPIYGKLGDR